MPKNKHFVSFIVLLTVLLFPLLSPACKLTSSDDALEYVNKEVSYASGESCVERYLFYEEDGKYERYIAGMYFGEELPGYYFGTLFETGTYTRNDQLLNNITFYPKKQYDFDTKQLEYLGLEGQVPYSGRLTDKSLTITWKVWTSYATKGEVDIVYERQ
ncbi:MAG: hypothetical protein IJJ71_13245 [Treponema sp.]|uniref:hypothetical protein n=1 Tax=Treponema sp. TaxID=166 RepID=UPI0025EB6503|nr:hypothetical protein [Treponema sp.]MBR0497124.1 hypothetical protein [Treponema sp.]